MEQKLKIAAHDGKEIDTWFNSQGDTDALIIFVHGLTGSPTEHHYIRAPEFFNAKGFDTVRFAQYATGETKRLISDTGVLTHAKDLNSVVSHYQNKYDKIYLVGHSLGAPVILEADLSNIERIVLWDPTIGVKSIEDANAKPCWFDERIGKYILINSGKEVLLGQEMIDSWIGASDLDKYTKLITKPCKFIFAGEEDKKDGWQLHLKDITAEHSEITIEGASHVFYEEGKLEQVYQETLSWIK
jgi:pimeloyl-ACP methyl ester carboxylesterase